MTIHPGRISSPSLVAVGCGIAIARDELAHEWMASILSRQPGSRVLDPGALHRPLLLILDLLVHMTGSMRREAREGWFAATELYGRLAEARGLSAGEVVDELQHLREILILQLGDLFVALPSRKQLPAILRLSRVLDTAVSNAVVGYTDALVAKMFSREGVPVPTAEDVEQLLAQLHALEAEVKLLDDRSAG